MILNRVSDRVVMSVLLYAGVGVSILILFSLFQSEKVAAQTEALPDQQTSYGAALQNAVYEAETALTELQGLESVLRFYLTFLAAKSIDTTEATKLLTDAGEAVNQISIFQTAPTATELAATLAAAAPADRQDLWLAHHQAYRLMRIHMNDAREKLLAVVDHLITLPQ